MDGNVAPMDEIVRLAKKYDALVMVDECHSAGVVGKPVVVSPKNSMCGVKLISSPEHLEKRLVVQLADYDRQKRDR